MNDNSFGPDEVANESRLPGAPTALDEAHSDLAASQLALSESLESVAFLQRVLDASGDCIKVLTLKGELVFMNEGGKRVMEVDDFDTVRGCAWEGFWEGPGRQEAEKALAAAREGRVGNFQGTASTAKGTRKFWDVTVTCIPGINGHPDQILSISRDITTAKETEHQKDLLSRELGHRLKNSLSIVQAIASQTFRGLEGAKLKEFNGRLAALGAAQALLLQTEWERISVREMIDQAVAPMIPSDRITVEMEDLYLNGRKGLALALALHELGTNAVKYGALSNDSGRIHIDVTDREGQFRLLWRETGGPPVPPPLHTGFGTRLMTRNLESDFGGTVELNFHPTGVVLTLSAPH